MNELKFGHKMVEVNCSGTWAERICIDVCGSSAVCVRSTSVNEYMSGRCYETNTWGAFRNVRKKKLRPMTIVEITDLIYDFKGGVMFCVKDSMEKIMNPTISLKNSTVYIDQYGPKSIEGYQTKINGVIHPLTVAV